MALDHEDAIIRKMKSLFVLAIFLVANVSIASSSYICQNEDQRIELRVDPAREEVDYYNECNGGVGDEMTGCVPHYFKILVRDAFLKVRVKGSYIAKANKLTQYKSEFSGFEIITDEDIALHIGIHISQTNPFLNMRIMKRGIPGNPIEVGDYLINCEQRK